MFQRWQIQTRLLVLLKKDKSHKGDYVVFKLGDLCSNVGCHAFKHLIPSSLAFHLHLTPTTLFPRNIYGKLYFISCINFNFISIYCTLLQECGFFN